jgi:hypothetical protein
MSERGSVMRRDGRTLIALLGAAVLCGGPTPASAQIDVDAVLYAIKAEYCLSDYWVPNPSRAAETWPVSVRIDGNLGYAWVEQLRKPRTHWATFYEIALEGGKPTVTSRMGYNIEVMQESPGYRESRSKVFGVDVHAAELKVPFKCTRVFEPNTPAKLAMVDKIQRSVAKILPFGRHAERLPKRVTIVIANFNVDDGMTYVVIRETKEVLGVLLVSENAPTDGSYIVWDTSNRHEWPQIRSRTMSTGIEREIQLGM